MKYRAGGTAAPLDAREAAGMRRELEAMLAERPDDIGPNRTPVGIA